MIDPVEKWLRLNLYMVKIINWLNAVMGIALNK